jgi:hypothetical protein
MGWANGPQEEVLMDKKKVIQRVIDWNIVRRDAARDSTSPNKFGEARRFQRNIDQLNAQLRGDI